MVSAELKIKCAAGTLRAYLRRRTDDALASFVSSRSLAVRGSWGTAPSVFWFLLYAQKERLGGEPYRLCTLQNLRDAFRRPQTTPRRVGVQITPLQKASRRRQATTNHPQNKLIFPAIIALINPYSMRISPNISPYCKLSIKKSEILTFHMQKRGDLQGLVKGLFLTGKKSFPVGPLPE